MFHLVFEPQFVTAVHSLSMVPPAACALYKFHITSALLCTYGAHSSEWEAEWFHCLLLTFSLGLMESLLVFFCTSLLHFRVETPIHGYIILFPQLLCLKRYVGAQIVEICHKMENSSKLLNFKQCH